MTDLVEYSQLICRQRAAGFDEVDDRIGYAQRDHDLDAAGDRHEMGLGAVLPQVVGGDVRKARGDAGAIELPRLR